jgi:ABC-type Fe3+/spermidine/putrescine transport system ATPase subunit
LSAIRIDGVERTFGSVRAVQDLSLEVRDGELFTLLGPSGCGKTTLLRMVAGFADLDKGSIHFREKRIDTLPPHRRNTGMVFQNYAIFPNLRVAQNVAYGLKARKVAAFEIAARVERALKLVQLGGFEARWPYQLSGGQLQRVALARALVIEPEVLLLDEPLSNLDAKLRVEMRTEIRDLQKSLGITALYVTHDQEEALAISDRIAVMRAGRIEQLGAPTEIYRQPRTPFVAEFIGATNLLTGRVAGHENGFSIVELGGQKLLVKADCGPAGREITMSLRPEALRPLAPDEAPPAGWGVLDAELVRSEFLGAVVRADLRLGAGAVLRMTTLDAPAGLGHSGPVRIAYDPANLTVFPAQ